MAAPPNATVLAADDLVVTLYQRPLTVADIDACDVGWRTYFGSIERPTRMMCVIDELTGPPSAPVRSALLAGIRKYQPQLRSLAVVMEGSGILVSGARAFSAFVTVVVRSEVKVFAEVEPAARWLMKSDAQGRDVAAWVATHRRATLEERRSAA